MSVVQVTQLSRQQSKNWNWGSELHPTFLFYPFTPWSRCPNTEEKLHLPVHCAPVPWPFCSLPRLLSSSPRVCMVRIQVTKGSRPPSYCSESYPFWGLCPHWMLSTSCHQIGSDFSLFWFFRLLGAHGRLGMSFSIQISYFLCHRLCSSATGFPECRRTLSRFYCSLSLRWAAAS